MDQNPTINVIIPLFNECVNLPLLVERLENSMTQLRCAGYEFEVVFVDDHSTDSTPELLATLLNEKPWLSLVRLSRNCGSYVAVAAGLKHCRGDCAVVMAADLQDPPEVIPELVAKWRQGYEVVWAARERREGESVRTRLFARAYYWLMRRLAIREIPAQGADFLLMDRKVIDVYNAISEKNTSFLGMVMWIGFRQTFVGYVKQARHAGKSKWTLSKKIKLFVDSFVSFSYAPIRTISWAGLIMSVCGFGYAIVVIAARLFGHIIAGSGFAAIMTVLLVGQGMIMAMLGILGEYVWRTFDEARGRPRYIVEEYRPARHSMCPDRPDARTTNGLEVGYEQQLADRMVHRPQSSLTETVRTHT